MDESFVTICLYDGEPMTEDGFILSSVLGPERSRRIGRALCALAGAPGSWRVLKEKTPQLLEEFSWRTRIPEGA